jgi:hypothetical protein
VTYSLELKVRIEGFGVTRFNEYRGNKGRLIEFIQRWIHKVRMDFGYRDMEILSVIVNGDEDLTEKFKK